MFESALAAVLDDPDLAVRLRPTLQRFRAVLAEVFERAIASGEMPPSDTEALAIVCTARLDGLWLHHLIDPTYPPSASRTRPASYSPKRDSRDVHVDVPSGGNLCETYLWQSDWESRVVA